MNGRFAKAAALICLLLAMVAGGNLAATAAERENQPPPEILPKADCAGPDCLIIEPAAHYCSIDPPVMQDGRLFSTKAELALASGSYPLSGPSAFRGLTASIRTPAAQAVLRPAGTPAISTRREVQEGQPGALEWMAVDGPYAAPSLTLERLFLRTSRWPHEQFRLGDPQDISWFYAAARNLFIKVTDGGSLFPGLSPGQPPTTIFFAPCPMRGMPDQHFRFEFADGSSIGLTVRVINGANQLGYYMGRLIRAESSIAGKDFVIEDRNRLAFFGSSRSMGEVTVPGLAIRTAAHGGVCGVLLDPSEWDTDKAINGYVAYEMTCQETRGRRLPLRAVTYPGVFSLP